MAVMDQAPKVVEVMGMITFPPVPDGGALNGNQVKVASNKTIIGADAELWNHRRRAVHRRLELERHRPESQDHGGVSH